MDDMTNMPVDEFDRLKIAVREALTDSMVERLATTSVNAMELIDRLNDPATSAAVHNVIDRVTELNKVGAIDTLFELMALVHAARSAATDNIVERLFMFFEDMIKTVGNEAMGTLAENARESLIEAAEEAARQPAPRGGVMATLGMLSKPETQKGLAFLLAFSQKLQQRSAHG